MRVNIRKIRIANFRSIDSLTLENIGNFAVFAGPNGAGKSNFFKALDFVATTVQFDAATALRKYGGYENVHSVKRRKGRARTFEFEFSAEFTDIPARDHAVPVKYQLKIHKMDSAPELEEHVVWGNNEIKRDGNGTAYFPYKVSPKGDGPLTIPLPPDISVAMFVEGGFFRLFFQGFQLFEINPVVAKEPDESDQDPSKLHAHGRNLATVLGRIFETADAALKEELLEQITTFVPGLEKVLSLPQRMTDRTSLVFKEAGTTTQFPAHLISDGTIYILSLLVAVLDRQGPGIVMIEEPERGIHPQVILQLVDLLREESGRDRLIWVTSHNETLVRGTRSGELWITGKEQGKTRMKRATLAPGSHLTMDQAWLSNVFNGGLPW